MDKLTETTGASGNPSGGFGFVGDITDLGDVIVRAQAKAGDVFINGTNCREKYGAHMGDGFLSSLLEPPTFKALVENTSVGIHGKRVYLTERMVEARDLNLLFIVCGNTPQKLVENRLGFMRFLASEMAGGKMLALSIYGMDEVGEFKLILQGKGTAFNLSLDRTVCSLGLKFMEPNPADNPKNCPVE